MKGVEVTTQADLDRVLKKKNVPILVGDGLFEIRGSSRVVARESSHVEAWESSHVEARESSHVMARESSHVEAWGSSHVMAWGSSHVEARGSSHVEAWDSSRVVARGSSHVEARDSSHVVAQGSSRVVARDSSHVEAWESSHVEARESSHVEAWGSSRVVARESSHVEAWGSSLVVAWGSSHVVAWESSHVEAWGSSHVEARGSSHVEAAKYVAVHQHSETAEIAGGVLIKIPTLMTPLEWCEFYGVHMEGELAILYKAVRDDYRSVHGMLYAPGTILEAPDWDQGAVECGGGLHFTADPMTAKIHFDPAATRFVACPVALADIVVHPHPIYPFKVKASRVAAPIYEVDQYGNRVNGKGSTT